MEYKVYEPLKVIKPWWAFHISDVPDILITVPFLIILWSSAFICPVVAVITLLQLCGVIPHEG